MVRESSSLVGIDAWDPSLKGPYRAMSGKDVAVFRVPDEPSRGVLLGRVTSGPLWPEGVHRMDRVVAVPTPVGLLPSATVDDSRVVLYFEPTSGKRDVICFQPRDGEFWWAFDPATWVGMILREDYVSAWTRPITSWVPLVNYNRMPHALKGLLQALQNPRTRRGGSGVDFPTLPFDDIVETIRRLCCSLACGSQVFCEGLWPDGRRSAATLVHDVDTNWILRPARFRMLREIVDREVALGFKGAWFVTANQVDLEIHGTSIKYLVDVGHEVGPHGWNHDSKLNYLSPERQRERIERALGRFEGLDVKGIRTPWYCRSPQLFDVLSRSFLYGTSVPNASGFFSTGSNSGCCTIFPYATRRGLHELPMTLPPDTSLDAESGYKTAMEIAERIFEGSGVIVATLHPQPHQSGNRKALARWFDFLEKLSKRFGDDLWHATPRDIVNRYARMVLGEGSPAAV